MSSAENGKQPDSVSSVLKVFGILQALGEERDHSITELAQRVMMSKSTVYRFLQTMKTLGYVTQEGESEKYSLTLKLFEAQKTRGDEYDSEGCSRRPVPDYPE